MKLLYILSAHAYAHWQTIGHVSVLWTQWTMVNIVHPILWVYVNANSFDWKF